MIICVIVVLVCVSFSVVFFNLLELHSSRCISLAGGVGSFTVNIYTLTHTHTHTYKYAGYIVLRSDIYIYIYVYRDIPYTIYKCM